MLKISIIKNLFALSVLGLTLFLNACKDDEVAPIPTPTPATNFSVELQYNSKPYTLGETIEINGIKVKLNVFMFLMTKPRTVDGGITSQIQDVMLVDLDPKIEANSPQRDIKRIGSNFILNSFNTKSNFTFGLGASSDVNGEKDRANYKPTSYPKGHPLANGMGIDWDVWKMYRHIRIEGMCDSSSSSSLRYQIKWHTGFDSLYFEPTYQTISGKSTMKMVINLNQMFNGADPIMLPKEKYTEMGKNLVDDAKVGIKVSKNLANSISIQ